MKCQKASKKRIRKRRLKRSRLRPERVAWRIWCKSHTYGTSKSAFVMVCE